MSSTTTSPGTRTRETGAGRKTKPGIRERMCGSKIRHETWTEAQKHLAQLPRKPGELMNVYKCFFGNHYHVGHYGKGRR